MNSVAMESYKFSETATDKVPDILNGKSEIDFLKSKYQKGCIFGLNNLQHNGCYKLSGWCFDFRPFLKKFIVKQYDSWQEYYAPNKTLLRNSIYGKINKIIEII
jgi:hypothetical protein